MNFGKFQDINYVRNNSFVFFIQKVIQIIITLIILIRGYVDMFQVILKKNFIKRIFTKYKIFF